MDSQHNVQTALRTEPDALGIATPNFKQVDDYTTFGAEYALIDGDIVFHFCVTDGALPKDVYWQSLFPAVLDPVAREHFRAGPERLKAAWVPEMAGWWLRAYGFGEGMAPEQLAEKFLEKLDQALDTKKAT